MNTVQIKNTVLATLALVGSAITERLGGWDAMLQVLIALMTADFVTGLLLAGVWKRSAKSESGALDSRESFKGLVKKCIVLVLVYIAVQLDNALGVAYARTAVMLFFIGNEGLSLLENIGLMGVPYPTFLKNMLQALHDKGDQGNTGDEHDKA